LVTYRQSSVAYRGTSMAFGKGCVIKISQLILYREIIAVCSEIHTKHINTVCGQNVIMLNVKLAVHIVTTGLQRVKSVL